MNTTGNKYLDDVSDATSDIDDDYNVHEVVKYGTYLEVKEVIAKDRPRLIALKDSLGRTVLHYAVLFDRTKIALFLISKNADINARDNDEATPLHLAAANGLTDMCRFLLEFKAIIKVKDSKCWTPLHHAVNGNHIETATLLVKRGVDLHAEDHKFGRTALHLAAEKGFTEMGEMLIIRGASLTASGDAFYSKTPLHLACINGHTETVLMLCQRDSDVNALSGLLDKTPLHFSIEKGHFEVVKILVQFRADVNAMGKHINGNTPLHLAAQYNHFNIIDHLLKQKDIQINQQGRFTTLGTPLHIACIQGNIHIVHLLLDYGADLSLLDDNGHSPLHIACLNQHYDLVTLLIEKHANALQLSLKKKTPIDYITNPIVKESMRQLVEKVTKLKKEEEEEIARQKRIQEHHQQILAQQLILQKQKLFEIQLYNEMRRNEFIRQLILICDKSGDLNALIRLSEEYGTYDTQSKININDPLILLSHLNNNPNFKEFRALPDIHPARMNQQQYQGGKLTLESGTDTFQTNHSTLMGHSGGGGGYPGPSNALVPYNGVGFEGGDNFDVSSQSSLGSIGSGYSTIFTSNRTHATALTLAALRGFYELVQGLLQWPGIDINIQENNGNTALHNAALINSRDICELLLLYGADNRIINHQGKTAANLTTKLSLQEIIRNPKLVSQKQHLQNTIIQSIFEKKKKVLTITNGINDDESSNINSNNNNTSKKDGKKVINNEISLKDLTLEKKMLEITNDIVKEYSSKNHYNHLPLIAPQFTNNIISQLHYKENPKLDQQQRLIPSNTKTSSNGSGGSALVLPDIYNSSGSSSSQLKAKSIVQKKYGNIPDSFGGNRSDFFQIKLYTSTIHPNRQSKRGESSFALFDDLFHIQRSYLPNSFDSTKEWNQIKDFLWLFGYPYRRQMVKLRIPITQQPPHPYHPHSTYSPYQQYPPQHPHAAALMPVMTMREEVQEDKRSIIYKIAMLMNDCQRIFTLPSHQIHFNDEPYFQHRLYLPNNQQLSLHSNINNNTTHDHEPESEHHHTTHAPSSSSSSNRDDVIEKELLQLIEFNNYCILQHFLNKNNSHDHNHKKIPKHITLIEDYYKLILFSNYCFLLLSHILYFFQPNQIRHWIHTYWEWAKEDYYYGHYLVRLNNATATVELESEKPNKKANTKKGVSKIDDTPLPPPLFEYRLYVLLQYEKEIYQLQSHYHQLSDNICQYLLNLLQYSMIQSYESFLSYYNYHFPEQAHMYHSDGFKYHPPHSSSTIGNDEGTKKKKKKKRKKISTKKTISHQQVKVMNSIQEEGIDEEDDGGDDIEELEEEEGGGDEKFLLYQDPLRQEWSDIIVNPPRSLRAIIDVIYDVTSSLQPCLEQLFPNDVVRGQLWLVEATEMMDKLIEEERQRLIKEDVLRQQLSLTDNRKDSLTNEAFGDDLVVGDVSSTALVPVTSPGATREKREDGRIVFTALQYWLNDLQLLEYESFFLVNGFKLLEDFQELSQDDCYMYFPFLKIGDLRRLSKNILNLTDAMIEFYEKKTGPKE